METKHTPGPWFWEVVDKRVSLIHPRRGHLVVMDFVRMGMHGGTCRFADWGVGERGHMGGIMHNANALSVASHPDARLIAAAPELLEALRRLLANDCPLHGNPSHETLVKHWEYEKTQGRCEADDQLFALAALARATGQAVTA